VVVFLGGEFSLFGLVRSFCWCFLWFICLLLCSWQLGLGLFKVLCLGIIDWNWCVSWGGVCVLVWGVFLFFLVFKLFFCWLGVLVFLFFVYGWLVFVFVEYFFFIFGCFGLVGVVWFWWCYIFWVCLMDFVFWALIFFGFLSGGVFLIFFMGFWILVFLFFSLGLRFHFVLGFCFFVLGYVFKVFFFKWNILMCRYMFFGCLYFGFGAWGFFLFYWVVRDYVLYVCFSWFWLLIVGFLERYILYCVMPCFGRNSLYCRVLLLGVGFWSLYVFCDVRFYLWVLGILALIFDLLLCYCFARFGLSGW